MFFHFLCRKSKSVSLQIKTKEQSQLHWTAHYRFTKWELDYKTLTKQWTSFTHISDVIDEK